MRPEAPPPIIAISYTCEFIDFIITFLNSFFIIKLIRTVVISFWTNIHMLKQPVDAKAL